MSTSHINNLLHTSHQQRSIIRTGMIHHSDIGYKIEDGTSDMAMALILRSHLGSQNRIVNSLQSTMIRASHTVEQGRFIRYTQARIYIEICIREAVLSRQTIYIKVIILWLVFISRYTISHANIFFFFFFLRSTIIDITTLFLGIK